MMRNRSRSLTLRLAGAGIVVGVLAACSSSAMAAEPPPHWAVTVSHANAFGAAGGRDPFSLSAKTLARASGSNFVTITVTNDGGSPSNGEPIVVKDKLPAGVVLAEEKSAPILFTGPNSFGPHSSSGPKAELCTKAVQCTAAAATFQESELTGPLALSVKGLNPGEVIIQGGELQVIAPVVIGVEQSFQITGTLAVMPDAQAPVERVTTVTNTATVTGGGAVGAASTDDPTTIVPAVPFGIFNFSADIEGEGGGPFTQASGHPFSMQSAITLNFTPGAAQTVNTPGRPSVFTPSMGIAGGPTKDERVEVPPGFLGNVLNRPRCALSLLVERKCPANTAVGFGSAAINGGAASIRPGQPGEVGITPATSENTGLVFNLQPTSGQPAELGFFAAKQPVPLEVEVHSDGDYGLTVGPSAASGRVLSVDVTLCENGSTLKNPGNFAAPEPICLPVTEGSRPFLTNPSKCEGSSPQWTLLAAPWNEPTNHVSKTVDTNASQTRGLREWIEAPKDPGSFITGCDKLQFNPAISFVPRPETEGEQVSGETVPAGTNHADEPTGVDFHLSVPQANDEPNTLATPALRDATMKLPPGMTVSPSAANGLEACTKSQFWPAKKNDKGEPLEEEPAEHREPAVPGECPNASQIGTLEVFTPLLSGAPTISGAPIPGKAVPVAGAEKQQALSCSSGMWSGGPWTSSSPQLRSGVEELENGSGERIDVAYQWLANGQPIAKATTTKYLPEEGDIGKELQCQVKANRTGGAGQAAASGTGSAAVSQPIVVLPEPGEKPEYPPPSVGRPGGEPAVGQTLTCKSGEWRGPFTYRWLRAGAPIAGQEASTYTLTAADEGDAIQCQLSLAAKNGTLVVADSAALIVAPTPSTPPVLPGAALQGQLFVAQPECAPCTNEKEDVQSGRALQNFIQAEDRSAGVVIKLRGFNKVPDPSTGQIESVFEEQPQQPFEIFALKLKGGPRAPLDNPQACGPATTEATLTPWSALPLKGVPGNELLPKATATSSFNVEGCTGAMPSFNPSFNGGTVGANAATAGASPHFSVTFGRNDGEQDLSGVQVQMPLGLVGNTTAVTECSDAQIEAAEKDKGECPASSKIGVATALVGTGSQPFAQKGRAYFTGPYEGQPFGVAVITRAKAGPFDFGNVVVRNAIAIDKFTGQVTVISDPIPQVVGGVPIRLHQVNVEINREGFMLNPTSCAEQHVSGTFNGMQTFTGPAGSTVQASNRFGIGGCKNLLFHPIFEAKTSGHTSKLGGASLNVKISYQQGTNYANIAKSVTDLPVQLPSRLETLHGACPDTVFEANPAACPEKATVGFAIAHTPLLRQPLSGPAILVSHGGRAFPDLEFVLQGENVTVYLDGRTDIKKGVTKTTFESVPDAPIETFELELPQGPHSILAAPEGVCEPTREATVTKSVAVKRKGRTVHVKRTVIEHVPEKLIMPTQLVGQNGVVEKQNTIVGVTGCPPSVKITGAKVSGKALLVSVKLSEKSSLTISGKGLKTTHATLAAGSHEVRVPLTRQGLSLHRRHRKTGVHAKVTVGRQSGSATQSVSL
jgi:hypothetical protein